MEGRDNGLNLYRTCLHFCRGNSFATRAAHRKEGEFGNMVRKKKLKMEELVAPV